MRSILPYIKIIRLNNGIMALIAVALGFWLSHSTLPWQLLAALLAAALFSTSFGNVINDLRDISTDHISHPARPLAAGTLSIRNATFLAWVCMLSAIISAAFISPLHVAAAGVPLLILLVYAMFLKNTPLAGNIIVSALVSYCLFFGGIGAPDFARLLFPAVLAFLLNFAREIIKDLQDEQGDRAAGLITTAALPVKLIRAVVLSLNGLHLLLLFVPWMRHDFGPVYAFSCLLAVMPLHLLWLSVFLKKAWHARLSFLSIIIKLEMAAGLAALAADQLFSLIT